MKCGSFNGDRHGAACYAIVNDIASRAFQSKGLGVLDAAKMLSQRVDAHPGSVPNSRGVDILHFCQPGPLSAVVAGMLTEVYARSAEES